MALGISFIPNQAAPDQQQPSQQQNAPLQQALQMLSLRIPRFGGSNPIAPDPLLQRQPGTPMMPVPGTPEWDAFWKRLMGGAPPSQPGDMTPPMPTPTPKVTPGYPRDPDKTFEPIGPNPGFSPQPVPTVPPPATAPPGKYWPGPGGITKTFDPYPDQKQY